MGQVGQSTFDVFWVQPYRLLSIRKRLCMQTQLQIGDGTIAALNTRTSVKDLKRSQMHDHPLSTCRMPAMRRGIQHRCDSSNIRRAVWDAPVEHCRFGVLRQSFTVPVPAWERSNYLSTKPLPHKTRLIVSPAVLRAKSLSC